MKILGDPFIKMEFSFEGLRTPEARQAHLEELAQMLEKKFADEISARLLLYPHNPEAPAEFFYMASSQVDEMAISEFDLKEFDIKVKANRFNKQSNPAAIKRNIIKHSIKF